MRRALLLAVFLMAFLPRLGGIALTTVYGVNPFGEGQVIGHQGAAENIAGMLTAGTLDLTWHDTYSRWGLVLSLFWFLPGPSGLYAQLAMATVGSLAVLVVFRLGAVLHSVAAGIVAALPLALLPSYILMHSVVQREAVILLAVVGAFYLVFAHPAASTRWWRYLLAGGLLLVPGYLRLQNIPLVIAIVVVSLVGILLVSARYPRRTKVTIASSLLSIGLITGFLIVRRLLTRQPVQYLLDLRARRTRGRATYLEWFAPTSLPEVAMFSLVAAVYFLFVPFPWHVETGIDLVGVGESLVTLTFAAFAVAGVRHLKDRALAALITLLTAIVLVSVLYGLGTANYGLAMRHRQVIVWAIFLLGGIGIAERWHALETPVAHTLRDGLHRPFTRRLPRREGGE